MSTTDHQPYQHYFPHYIQVPGGGRAIPAIFKRNAKQLQHAQLFLIKGQRAVESPDQAVEIAQGDLEEALKVVLPIVNILTGEGFLKAALLKQGYTWPGVEPVVVELPQVKEQVDEQ